MTNFSIPVACSNDLLSGSAQPKRVHRGTLKMTSIIQTGWEPATLQQTGRQLLGACPLGARKPAIRLNRSQLAELGQRLPEPPSGSVRLEPEVVEAALTEADRRAVVFFLAAINAAEPGALTIINRQVRCRVASTDNDTVTIQFIRSIVPIRAIDAVAAGQLAYAPGRKHRLVPTR